MSPRWYQPPINLDFSLSEEFSPEKSPLDKKSESWDLTMFLEKKKISMRKQFKEPSS